MSEALCIPHGEFGFRLSRSRCVEIASFGVLCLKASRPQYNQSFLNYSCCLSFQPGRRPRYNNNVLGKKVTGTCKLVGRKRTLLISGCIDDEFRSSRNIAISLHGRYKNVVERGFSKHLKDFITAGVTAYAVGCTDEGLRSELLKLSDSQEESADKLSTGVSTSVKLKLTTEEINECILWSTIVFITILCTPQPTVVRWSSTSPVSAEAQSKWGGFCALIANAYYIRGMAWLPVKTLQLEQMAAMGHAEEPSLVADRMRIVFATLENVSPQWPKVE